MRLLGVDWVRKDDLFPRDEDSDQWFAWFSGFPLTSKLEKRRKTRGF